MSVTIRLFFAVVLVAAIHSGAILADKWRLSQEVVVPREELQELPMILGSFSGEAVDLDYRLFIATGADLTVDRTYRDAAGHSVVLHIAAFGDYSHITPHHPDLCFSGAGWTAVSREDVELKADNELPVTAQIITFEQESQRIRVMFWYQVGNLTAVDYRGVRQAIVKARRAGAAPPLIKVLLQVPATDSAADKKRLCEVAEPVFAWVKKATGPPAPTSAGEQ